MEPSRDDVVTEIVRRILLASATAAKSLVDEQSLRAAPVLLDHIFFNFQWVDRVALKLLGGHRHEFVDRVRDGLMHEVGTILWPQLSAEKRMIAITNMGAHLDDFMTEFAGYRAPSPTSDSMSGTLLYEFGKTVANKLGGPDDPRLIAAVAAGAAAGILSIDAPSLLRLLPESQST